MNEHLEDRFFSWMIILVTFCWRHVSRLYDIFGDKSASSRHGWTSLRHVSKLDGCSSWIHKTFCFIIIRTFGNCEELCVCVCVCGGEGMIYAEMSNSLLRISW